MFLKKAQSSWDRRGRMVVIFTIIGTIRAYHH